MTRDSAIGAPLVEEISPAPDPPTAFERLRGLPYPIFLDSASDPTRLGRYSFITADPWAVVSGKGGRTTVLAPQRRISHHGALGQATSDSTPTPMYASTVRVTDDDPLTVVRTLLAPCAADPQSGLPPFQGGAAGYIGYDYGRVLERIPEARYDDLDIPDVLLGLYDWVLAWDHQARRCWLIAHRRPEDFSDPGGHSPSERCAEIRRLLSNDVTPYPAQLRSGPQLAQAPLPSSALTAGVSSEDAAHIGAAWVAAVSRAQTGAANGGRATEHAPSFPVPGHRYLRSSFTHQGYLDVVARVREYILAGDIFQANLSQRLEAPYDDDPWTLYRRLRVENPASFAAYIEAPGLAVMSASPERFLQVGIDGTVETRPIKGTRPRGIGPEHDAHLGRALVESEKDRAENLMIVDLLRNDLSRVCRPGSVRVPELFALEHYSTVHHLVSTVVGRLAPGFDAIDTLRATFPGGSITGAPKVRAMEIIAELEPSRRGAYCGSIGYLSATGAADFSIVIRTYLARHGRVFFSVGGGIIADSEPEAEYLETLDKARALIASLPDLAPTAARTASV